MNLTRTEADKWLKILHGWLPIAEFAEALERLETTQGDYLLTDPRAGFYRDAYTANEFARLMGADLVRLVAGERPDFEVDLAGAVHAYEATEADTPGRKRGREIQEQRKLTIPGQPLVTDFPVEDWLTPDQADSALRTASERKSKRTYDPNCGLVILLNPVEFGAHQAAIEATMANATAAVRNRFSAVWVMWKGVAYCTWRNGKRANAKLKP